MSSLAFEPWGSQIGTSMRQGESKATKSAAMAAHGVVVVFSSDDGERQQQQKITLSMYLGWLTKY